VRSEERRLFYVGMTRARTRLILTRALTRRLYGEPMPAEPSRSLQEIPSRLLGAAEAISRRRRGGRMLDKVARSLKSNPHVLIGIAGHADSTGTAAYNKWLSKTRADAVRDYLISKGVPASRLETKGYGSRQPIADNDTPVGRAENRRVEMARFS
jgi:outer membrane protein OmpA-like peptidoglycan-associated protein